MPRNISFSMTEPQFLDGSKTVTRRMGWPGWNAPLPHSGQASRRSGRSRPSPPRHLSRSLNTPETSGSATGSPKRHECSACPSSSCAVKLQPAPSRTAFAVASPSSAKLHSTPMRAGNRQGVSMAENSKIAWTDHTFNPWIGCTKVGRGCDGCYAEVWDARYGGALGSPHWGPGAPRRRTTVQNWNKVRRWERDAKASGQRPRVFCASLADVFDNEVPHEWRADLWALIADCPSLDWIIVTKRVGNVAKMAPIGGAK